MSSNPLKDQRYFEKKADEYGVRARIVEPVKLVNKDTGEVYDAERIVKFTNHQNFVKCYLADFLDVLGGFSAQMDVLLFMVENTNTISNQFIGSMRKISEWTGCSTKTVQRAVDLALERGLFKKIATGVYLLNPNLLVKGSEGKRHLLIDYFEAEDTLREMNDGNKKNNKG